MAPELNRPNVFLRYDFTVAVEPLVETSGRPPFAEAYASLSAPVFRFCLLHTGNVAVAEDLAAEAMTAAFEAYGSAPETLDGIRTWLFRIARNTVIDNWRRDTRRSRILDRFARGGHLPEPDVEEIAAIDGELARVAQLMAHLKPRDRRLLGLRIAAELSNKEVASIMGTSENTAAHGVARAIRRLKHLNETMP